MATNNKSAKEASRSYLAKDFNSFRNELLTYARNYFSEQITDFSEASLGGMFLELAAFVGDNLSFYLDYQFNELNPVLAIETNNIVNHAKNAGVKPVGASPAVAMVTFYIEVPSTVLSSGAYAPDSTALPIIKEETLLKSNTGIPFTLAEDLDFSETNKWGVLLATYSVSEKNSTGTPNKYILTREAMCLSGQITTQNFTIPNNIIPFRKITLGNIDVSEIINVKDSAMNEYYQVESLAQDVVYRKVKNIDQNSDIVPSNLELLPAPFRYITSMDFRSRTSTITFGSGQADSLDDDIIPDPSELALPLYGKQVFSSFSIDPNSLLKSKTLGVSPSNTNIKVQYRYGGGLAHNVAAESIRNVMTLEIEFPLKPSTATISTVTTSLDVKNLTPASGGAPASSLDELRAAMMSSRNQQNRIVTQQDLLARIYTLPNNFGRVFRAGISKSERNPLASILYLACQDADGKIIIAPDALKKNIRTYLNEYRLITDAIDVLDATVINYGIKFALVVTPSSNKSTVINKVAANLKTISAIKYFQMDQPLVESDIINSIINTEGVLSLVSLEVTNISGDIEGRTYSDYVFDVPRNSLKGLIIGPPGSIFELRHGLNDIVGSAE